jgi:hypothetical protein
MHEVYGLIIDESGTPGLYSSPAEAKKQAEKEMMEFFGSKFWADQLRLEWTTPIDANYETLDAYEADTDEFIDDFDYQVWEVVLWEDEENA